MKCILIVSIMYRLFKFGYVKCFSQNFVKRYYSCGDDVTEHTKKLLEMLPEEPSNCCMSGCANCVWIEYANKLTEIFKDEGENAKLIILEKVKDPNMKAFLLIELKPK